MKKKNLFLGSMALITLTLVGLFFYDFFSSSSEKNEDSSRVVIRQEVIIFEETFFELLNERFDQLFQDQEEISESSLISLEKEAIGLIKEFEEAVTDLNSFETERLHQLRFYTYLNISKDADKAKKAFEQFPPGQKKMTLLDSYINTFSPLIEEEKLRSFLNNQNKWASKYDKDFLKTVDKLIFFSNPFGKVFPDYFGDNKSLKSESIALNDFKGKITLIDFWATWCSPCLIELPYFTEAYNKYGPKGTISKNRFDIISISLDTDQDYLKKFINEREIEWIQFGDGKGFENSLVRDYHVKALPTLYLLDEELRVVGLNLNGKATLKYLSNNISL